MAIDVPKCPRCPSGGKVTKIKDYSTPGERSTQPDKVRTAELFGCTCGWTIIRTIPQEKRSDETPLGQ